MQGLLKTFATTPKPERATHVQCPLCGAGATGERWGAEGFEFARCAACGLVRQDPQPVPEDVMARYDAEYLDYEAARHFDFRDLELMALRDVDFSPAPGLRFLDVGCATGALLAALRDSGCAVSGVEVCRESAEYGRRVFGLDIHAGPLETAPYSDGSFDVVHASHLIEHLNDPRAFLFKAKRLLSPGGALILTTPNEASFQGRLMRGRWRSAIRDHLFLFSRRTLTQMLLAEGFVPERLCTWGGWPSGMRPRLLKAPMDAFAKFSGLGDVMVLRARRP